MVYMFVCASFDYYLINFYLKYMPGNIYTNSIMSSLAEAVSSALAGPLVNLVGPSRAMRFSFIMAGMFAVLLFVAERAEWNSSVPVIVLGAKFGICLAFGALYISNLVYFPDRFMGFVFGVCNVTARLLTILSPMVAEAEPPTPVLSYVFSCFLAGTASCFLVKTEDDGTDDN